MNLKLYIKNYKRLAHLCSAHLHSGGVSTYILGFGLAVLRRGCGGEPCGDAEPVSATLMYVYSHTHSVLAEMHLSAVFAHCRH